MDVSKQNRRTILFTPANRTPPSFRRRTSAFGAHGKVNESRVWPPFKPPVAAGTPADPSPQSGDAGLFAGTPAATSSSSPNRPLPPRLAPPGSTRCRHSLDFAHQAHQIPAELTLRRARRASATKWNGGPVTHFASPRGEKCGLDRGGRLAGSRAMCGLRSEWTSCSRTAARRRTSRMADPNISSEGFTRQASAVGVKSRLTPYLDVRHRPE